MSGRTAYYIVQHQRGMRSSIYGIPPMSWQTRAHAEAHVARLPPGPYRYEVTTFMGLGDRLRASLRNTQWKWRD